MCANVFVAGHLGDNRSAIIANLKGQIAKLRCQITELQHLNEMNRQKLLNMQQSERDFRGYVQALMEKVTVRKNDMANLSPFLQAHLNRSPACYPEQNVPILLEMSQCGEGLWSLFVEHLGFPCWRTIQRWRSNFLLSKGISRDVLDGSLDSLRKLFSQYFGAGYEARRPRVVLAVDAAGVSPNVVVHKDGHVDGFLDPDASLPIPQAMHLRESLDELRNFISANRESVVRDFFVVLACPLESNSGGLPIMLYPKQNGAADQNFVDVFLEVSNRVKECRVDVVGLSFDGDAGYLRFVRSITSCFALPDLMKSLWQQEMSEMMMFEDLLHLAKCVRYRFVCGSRVCPYPHTPEGICVEDFEKIGVVSWVLDPSQVRKMDDFLPLMMFSVDNVLRAVQMGMEPVAVALSPMTLALSAVMDPKLTRTERLDYLATAWALFWCYKEAYTKVPAKYRCQTAGKEKGLNQAMQIYDITTLEKGLSLFYCLSKIISDTKPVHLGALGTHWLEHLFGNIRRLCSKNDCPGNFERCLLLIMLKKLFYNGGEDGKQRKRLSDSGAILPAACEVSNTTLPLGSFIHEAGCLLQLRPGVFEQPAGTVLYQATRFPTRFGGERPSVRFVIKESGTRPDCGSSTASRMASAAGLTTRKRDVMASQV